MAAVERLMEKYASVRRADPPAEDGAGGGRSVLPNATEVKIVVSANVRAWRTMLELRLGEGAELEIRRMALACLSVLKAEAPALFADFEVYRAGDGTEAGTRRIPQGVRLRVKSYEHCPSGMHRRHL